MKTTLFVLFAAMIGTGIHANDDPNIKENLGSKVTQTKPAAPRPQLHPPTNLDEFNYITKGYKIQIESGLDPVKSGYTWGKYDELYMGDNNTVVGLRTLYRVKDNSVAGTVLFLHSYSTNKKYYLCIPNTNKNSKDYMYTFANEIVNLKTKDINAYNAAMGTFIELAMYYLESD